jgi:hypothetical protein
MDPATPHIKEIHPLKPARPLKKYTAPKPNCRDWHGHTTPVPKQGKGNCQLSPAPAPGNQLLTELWHHRMGHPGTPKLCQTQQHTTGIPTLGPLHPLFGCNNCNIAKLTKQAQGKDNSRAAHINGERFHMDYGFCRGPSNLARKVKRKYGKVSISLGKHKPIIESHEGYTAYLLIVDSKARKVWVFPTKTKGLDLFLQRNGLKDGTQRYIRTDLGGKLANSQDFRDLIAKHGYLLETTGALCHW